MTAIKTLDLSFNDLSYLSDSDIFLSPKNLTSLILSHNYLSHLPWREIIKMKNLKILDLEYNHFTEFNDKLMIILSNNITLRFAGKIIFFYVMSV